MIRPTGAAHTHMRRQKTSNAKPPRRRAKLMPPVRVRSADSRDGSAETRNVTAARTTPIALEIVARCGLMRLNTAKTTTAKGTTSVRTCWRTRARFMPSALKALGSGMAIHDSVITHMKLPKRIIHCAPSMANSTKSGSDAAPRKRIHGPALNWCQRNLRSRCVIALMPAPPGSPRARRRGPRPGRVSPVQRRLLRGGWRGQRRRGVGKRWPRRARRSRRWR
ncbi:hypothetical protein COGO111599_09070 [Corynebacterium gottingense]